ncbi:hypothetical protein P7C70_g1754, partial [Phenoliferia sp. Uapishka_3]
MLEATDDARETPPPSDQHCTTQSDSNPYNPALHLSEEALDSILSFVLAEAETAVSTCWAFCLITRLWLDSARRALYHSPLRAPPKKWSKSVEKITSSFQRTLEERSDLASRVRSLEGLPGWAVLVGASAFPYAHESIASTWQVNTIDLCPRTTSVFVFLSESQAERRLGRLIDAVSSLERLMELGVQSLPELGLRRSTFTRFNRAIAKKFESQAKPRILDRFVADEIGWYTEDDDSDQKGIGALVQACSYIVTKSSLMSARDLSRIIPSQPFHLREVYVETSTQHLSKRRLENLVHRLPAALEAFTLSCVLQFDESESDWEDPYAEYRARIEVDTYPPDHEPYIDTSTIPDILFNSFPNLLHLTLRGCRGLQVTHFETLAVTSPALSTIDLDQSVYATKDLDIPLLLKTFSESFPKLGRLHVGTLPVVNLTSTFFETATRELRSRGVICAVGYCDEMECMECGEQGCEGECMDKESAYGYGSCGSDCECGN